MISTDLQINVLLMCKEKQDAHTCLLMKIDILNTRQISDCVPTKKLHCREDLLDCKCALIMNMSVAMFPTLITL